MFEGAYFGYLTEVSMEKLLLGMHAAIGTAATYYLYRCTGQLFEAGLDLGLYRMSIGLNLQP